MVTRYAALLVPLFVVGAIGAQQHHQHGDHGSHAGHGSPAEPVERPTLFLDKSPLIVC